MKSFKKKKTAQRKHKLQTDTSHELRHKNSQQIISKSNPVIYKNELYIMTTLDLFQIFKADSTSENYIDKVKKENHLIISIDTVK